MLPVVRKSRNHSFSMSIKFNSPYFNHQQNPRRLVCSYQIRVYIRTIEFKQLHMFHLSRQCQSFLALCFHTYSSIETLYMYGNGNICYLQEDA